MSVTIGPLPSTKTYAGIPITTILNSSGFYGRRYVGYFDDDINFFTPARQQGEVSENVTFLSNFTRSGFPGPQQVLKSIAIQAPGYGSGIYGSGANLINADNYSYMWLGFFFARKTGVHTFYTMSDDASYVWVGDTALSGYTSFNALVNNGGRRGTGVPMLADIGGTLQLSNTFMNAQRSGTINLVAGRAYPVRIMYGESGGTNYRGDKMFFKFTEPGGILEQTAGLNYYYGGSALWQSLNGSL
jgi:hypothetical protein